ncbi:MAG: hypothetical protein KDJ52_08785, partial [Anaerolineae bacterium]|nr:hypothetical protein [Anaerolineae bacterium]
LTLLHQGGFRAMLNKILLAGLGMLILLGLGLYIDATLHNEVVTVIRVLIGAISCAVVSVLFVGVVYFALSARESVLIKRAARQQEQREIVQNDNGTWLVETGKSGLSIRALHLDPRTYQNGVHTEPTAAEYKAWQVWTESRGRRPSAFRDNPHLLPASVEEEKALDLLSVFTQTLQCYAIIGGQQTGKTYQARHIANYWLAQGVQPWVIGPKWDNHEWNGCKKFGGNGDMQAVENGIRIVTQEVSRRHADSRPHKSHAVLPIFFDDWTPIVDGVSNARKLILEATTLYASVNIILYFILHSDTADAWGVGKKGAALKDNFVKLFIQPYYDERGQVIREKTTAYIRFSGETVNRPITLISAPIASMSAGALVVDTQDYSFEIEPTEEEAEILKCNDEGLSVSAIAEKVLGSKGGPQNKKIRDVLEKFDI